VEFGAVQSHGTGYARMSKREQTLDKVKAARLQNQDLINRLHQTMREAHDGHTVAPFQFVLNKLTEADMAFDVLVGAFDVTPGL